MYTGNNPTALQSQTWLVNTLIEMLHTTKYSKISIKTLCINSKLSRQTFYQFFKSKDEVMHYCIKRNFFDILPTQKTDNLVNMIPILAKHIAENRDFIKLLNDNNLDSFFEEELSAVLTDAADSIHPDRDRKTKRIANSFLKAAISKSLLVWSQECDVTEVEYLDLLSQILDGKYYKSK